MQSRLQMAKLRQQKLLGSLSNECKFRRWSLNKEYSLGFHDEERSTEKILLDSQLFKNINSTELLEIILVSNKSYRLIFQINKKKNLTKTITNISLSKVYLDLLKNGFESRPLVNVREAKEEDYKLNQVEILITKKGISKSEILVLTQDLLDKIIYQGQIISLNCYKPYENLIIGKFNQLNEQNNCLCGIMNDQTELKLYSNSSDLYFVIEISQNSYYFSSLGSCLRYEYVLNYFQCLFNEFQKNKSSHTIHILFSSRIYFHSLKDFKGVEFIHKSILFDNEMYFDIFSLIEIFNSSVINVQKIIKKIKKAFNTFHNIFKFNNVKEFLKNLNENDILDKTYPNIFKKKIDILNSNIYSRDFFDEMSDFRLSNSLTSNLFEATWVPLNEIVSEMNSLKKSGSLINIILSGEYFPYYNSKLQEKVRQGVYSEFINLIYTCFTTKNKFELYMYKNTNLKGMKIPNSVEEQEEFRYFDNFSNNPPEWCKIYLISPQMLNKKIYESFNEYYKCDGINFFKDHPPKIDPLLEIFSEKVEEDLFNILIPEKKNINENYNNNNNNYKNYKKLKLEDLKKEMDKYYRKKDDKFELNLKEKTEKYNRMISEQMANVILESRKINGNIFIKDNFEELIKEIIYVKIPNFKDSIENLNYQGVNLSSYRSEYKKKKDIIFSRIDKNYQILTDLNLNSIRLNDWMKQNNTKISLCNRKYIHDIKVSDNGIEIHSKSLFRFNEFFYSNFLIYDDATKTLISKANRRKDNMKWEENDDKLNQINPYLSNDYQLENTISFLIFENKKNKNLKLSNSFISDDKMLNQKLPIERYNTIDNNYINNNLINKEIPSFEEKIKNFYNEINILISKSSIKVNKENIDNYPLIYINNNNFKNPYSQFGKTYKFTNQKNECLTLFYSIEFNEEKGLLFSLQYKRCSSSFLLFLLEEINSLIYKFELQIKEIPLIYYLDFNLCRKEVWKIEIKYKIETLIKTLEISLTQNDYWIKREYECNKNKSTLFYDTINDIFIIFMNHQIILFNNSNINYDNYDFQIFKLYIIQIQQIIELFKFLEDKFDCDQKLNDEKDLLRLRGFENRKLSTDSIMNIKQENKSRKFSNYY